MTASTTTDRGRLTSARFYITFRCNSLCGYCNVWQDDKFKGYEELTLERGRQILDELYELGVRYVDFTGGEPVLHPHIDGIVQHAKSLGMAVEITSNGIRFAQHIEAIVPYVDTMNVSLDTLRPDRYRQIRGVPTLDRALDVIQKVVATGSGNLKLICVVTRENVDEIPDLLRFAHENRTTVYFSGMFEYFDEQDTVRDTNRTARKLKLIEQNGKPLADATAGRAGRMDESEPTGGPIAEQLIRLLHQPYALVNLHFRKYMETLDPTAPTDCYANKRILTVGPDGRLVLPCYHAFDNSVAWDRPLRELVEDPEFLRVRDEEVGHRSECRSCTVFPYIGLSFSHRFDKVFLYQALSEEIAKFKRQFTDPLFPRLPLDLEQLHSRYSELEHLIDQALPTPRPPESADHFYRFETTGTGVRSEFAAGELSVAELIGDYAHGECWGIQRSPHTWIRLVYRELVPALRELLPQEAYESVVAELYEVQLAWWYAYLTRYYQGTEQLDGTAAEKTVAGFLTRTGALLPEAPAATRVREVLLHAGCVLGLSPETLAPLAVRTPFPEAALIAKHLLLIASDAELPRYAELLPEEAAEPLRRAPLAPPTGDVPPLDPETARLLGQDNPLPATVDEATAEKLIAAVTALAPEDREGLAARLLTHELRTPGAVRRRGAELRSRGTATD
ncbi:radical SAM protein [Streptomyces griseofuscus]|uniref:GTP 3',8-cyclase n=1 Tax=Streptomyces griseofuscus TaxID=146922 RepID=A0A7H1QA77_9ACTN|nr:radical SAM protein [Streptomyces griseofuscus]QNT97207.1 GTP 3',8-cyclase [Streptomyces griseofuscus]BBC97806.1 radical SAM protein [Streptomyces rochei]